MAVTKRVLSGSTNGRGIDTTGATATGSAITIHTAVSGTTSLDEIWIWATNRQSSEQTVSIEFGGTGATNTIECIVDAHTTALVVPGLILQNGLLVKGFSPSAVLLTGYVHRIS